MCLEASIGTLILLTYRSMFLIRVSENCLNICGLNKVYLNMGIGAIALAGLYFVQSVKC